MTHHNRDTWNKHKWRKETSWWDNLTVDGELIKERYADVFEWLEEVAPDPYEHDCVLYTDGSGCTEGWGGYAAVWERIDLIGEVRAPVSRGCYVAGTYGSTVSRSEFSALLDGVHSILTERGRELQEQTTDSAELYKIGTEGILNQFTGPDRVSILWYTDRSSLAHAFLYNEDGDPLMSRMKERDLWMRWSFMAKHVCITPMCRPRNVVDGQAICDALAGAARALLKGAREELAEAASKIYPTEKWQKMRPQTAIF